MKHAPIYLLPLAMLFSACGNNENKEAGGGTGDPATKKNISKRDYNIKAANAYSDLFFDSSKLESFIKTKALPDSVANRMRSFYNARNYQMAWFSSDGLTEQARGFWNLHDYHRSSAEADSVLADKQFNRRMDRLIAEEKLSPKAGDTAYLNTELALTYQFIHYMRTQYDDGYIKRKEMERFVPRKKEDAVALADSLLNKKHKDNKYFEDVHKPYRLLKDYLGKYVQIVKAGGWPEVPAEAKSLKQGMSTSAVAVLKKRLQISGDLPSSDSSQMFGDTLAQAIRNFQTTHGYTADGKMSTTLIKELNVSAEARLQQLLVNLGRMRWLPPEAAGNLIMVNIPEFMLHVYEGNKKAFDMVVVVGKEGHNTTTFTGDLNQVVFSPYWNVPESIVKNEIMPGMARNASYLEQHNMEVVKDNGNLPTIRQKPGGSNALGQVKFLFPNSFDIYFHDTPSKSLFSKDKRAYSHGCIRLAEPQKMAEYLLRNDPKWSSDSIYAAMNRGEEKYVRLKDPVPVVITYYTAWVDDAGRLNFRDDVYGHDKKLVAKMFMDPAKDAAKSSESVAKK